MDKQLQRIYGIDLLRILSMVMVVFLHVLWNGVLDAYPPFSSGYISAWFLEIASFCAVNLFGMISGFVGYGRKIRLTNLFYLCIQVSAYVIITTLLFYFFRPEMVQDIRISEVLFPFAYGTYWYFTAYFVCFFFTPLINKCLDLVDRRTVTLVLGAGFILFSIVPIVFQSDITWTNKGYHPAWLIYLYILGGYLRKYYYTEESKEKKGKPVYLLIYIGCVIFTLFAKLLLLYLTQIGKPILPDDILICYTSPTMIVSAVVLLLLFKDIHCSKVIKWFATVFGPAAFAVYIFHQEPLIAQVALNDRFGFVGKFSTPIMLAVVFGTVFIIWFTGSVVDIIREKLFKLLKVKKLCALLDNMTMTFVGKLLRRLKL